MKCPKCNYESPYFGVTISRSNPCIACGYDMNRAEFYNEAETICLKASNIISLKNKGK